MLQELQFLLLPIVMSAVVGSLFNYNIILPIIGLDLVNNELVLLFFLTLETQ